MYQKYHATISKILVYLVGSITILKYEGVSSILSYKFDDFRLPVIALVNIAYVRHKTESAIIAFEFSCVLAIVK